MSARRGRARGAAWAWVRTGAWAAAWVLGVGGGCTAEGGGGTVAADGIAGSDGAIAADGRAGVDADAGRADGRGVTDADADDGPGWDGADAPGAPDSTNSDAGDGGAGSDSVGAECPPGTVVAGVGCADVDLCAADNGGCGPAAQWTCVERIAALPRCRFNWADDWAALTAGVSQVDSGEWLPDALIVHGPKAFPVVLDEQGHAMLAASRYGDGRTMHVPHEGPLTQAASGVPGWSPLMANAARWLTDDLPGATIGVSAGLPGVATWLESQGFSVVADATPSALGGLDALILTVFDGDARTPAEDASLLAFVGDGGGLMTVAHAWWWAYVTGGSAPATHPANTLLPTFGYTLSGDPVVSASLDTVGPQPPGPGAHAGHALTLLEDHSDGTLPQSAAALGEAARTVGYAGARLPLDGAWFAEAAAFTAQVPPVIPTVAAPVAPATEPVAWVAVVLDSRRARELPAEAMITVPAAQDFPGAVPEGTEAVTRTVALDLTWGGRDARFTPSGADAATWTSTGLYAAPGATVTVTAPPEALAAQADVLVGGHTDSLWQADAWTRFPEVTRAWPLTGPVTTIRSAFGGPIFLRTPKGAVGPTVDVTVAGAVPMPRWVQGQTTPTAWEATERHHAAPWGELDAGPYVILAPGDAIRALDDPGAVAGGWRQILDLAAQLSGEPAARARAERLVFDRQISAGWMHSGYPMMAQLPSVPDALDPQVWATVGAWGLLHELGHNHQNVDWLLPGTGESSCNLWSVRLSEEVFGIGRADAHPALTPTERAKRIAAWQAGGAPWSVWTALETYLQLQEAFGWSLYEAVFAAYLALPDAQRPTDDPARVDRWVTLTSAHAGVNLGPFYQAWGLTPSADALATAAALPPWQDDPTADW